MQMSSETWIRDEGKVTESKKDELGGDFNSADNRK